MTPSRFLTLLALLALAFGITMFIYEPAQPL